MRTRLTLAFLFALLTVSVVSAQETAADCEVGFHLFDHELLATEPVCIPDDAQRIVALDSAAVELLLYTDKEIVGTFGAFVKDEFSAMLPIVGEQLTDVPGLDWPVNLELVLGLEPDLIAVYLNESMPFDLLSEIAPTVVFNAGIAQGNWQIATEFWSEVFGEEDLYAEMLATYDARVAELQDALGEDRGEIEVSTVLASSYFNMIMLAESPLGSILSDVGLGRPASQALNSEEATAVYGVATYAYLTDETLPLGDGDVIFIHTFPALGEEAIAASDAYLDAFEANPLWAQISQDKSVRVGAHWTRANTYLLANAVLDDLFAALTDTEATTPNPIAFFTVEITE